MTNFPKIGTFIESSKHILFITPGFRDGDEDSSCIPALWIYAKALVESGVKVSIIALQYPFTKKKYEWNGISVYPLNGANKKWKQLNLAKKALDCAGKIHRKKSVDVVHSFWLHRATEIAMKVADSLDVPLVATAMGQEMRHPQPGFEKWKNVDFPIVAISEFQSDALKQQGVLPSTIVPWGLGDFLVKEKRVDLICVGSLIPLKNMSYFVDLCAELKKVHPDFEAVIIGDGPEKNALNRQIASKGLQSNLKIVGPLPHNATIWWIGHTKVLVSASNFEGFGMTIIEALACETHVIATPVGIAKSLEIPHLIGDVALDAAMIEMLLKANPPEHRLFDIQETIRAYAMIYESVSKGKAIDS